MTGNEIFRSMCSALDKDGNTIPPSKTYATLTPEEKIVYLEWREDQLCDEFNEEIRRFEETIYPLRPHNDKRFRRAENGYLVCPTFYDGCNCKPDHTQEDWNNLKAQLDAVETENKILREMDAGHLSMIEGLRTRVELLTEENLRLRETF